MENRAKIVKEWKEHFNSKHRKEDMFRAYKVLDTNFNTVVDCRLYQPGRSSTCYCCLWVSAPDKYKSGSGTAGGYGYHKASSAVGSAVRNAGFSLDKYIDGVGDKAIEGALLAVARCVRGRRKFKLVPMYA